jgi:hypothetical protein
MPRPRSGNGLFEAPRLGNCDGASAGCKPKDLPPLVGAGGRLGFLQEALLAEPVERTVERARQEPELADGAFLDIEEDRVAVPLAVGE